MHLLSSPAIVFAFGALVALLNSKTACGANAYFIVARGNGGSRFRRATLFFVGALAASTAIYTSFGLLALVLGGMVLPVLAMVWSIHAVFWYVRRRRWIPLGRLNVQADPHVAARRGLGVVYLGAMLGSGLMTVMATPLVQVGALLCASNGVSWAVWYGVGFAVGRSGPSWFAVWSPGAGTTPHETSLRFVTQTQLARLVGGALSLTAIAFAAGALA